MKFPPGFIEELKYRNDLEQVVSRYVPLRRAGSNMVGCCPFHSEKTPSFTLFADRHYHCFGCGAGGDVITFVMNIENLDYVAAVERLCSYAGIDMPAAGEDDLKAIATRKRLLALNHEAAKHFFRTLFAPEGKPALEYLTGRGLSAATLRHFGLGFAPQSWDSLTKAMGTLGFTSDELKAAFLSGINKNGKPFDYFRGRVIFPIVDLSGAVIAFGGRVMDSSQPKYLNSSDTAVFKKSRNLYALNYAKAAASSDGRLILCEGYMDVIALHQAGFTGAVATLGTAITAEQARLIAKYARKVVISYDSDNAGVTAAKKATDLLNAVGVEVRILNMQSAKDPDEYIRKFGADAFQRLLDGSPGYVEHRIAQAMGKRDLSLTDQKIAALREVCEILADIPSPVEREVYAVRAAAGFELTTANLLSQVERLRKGNTKRVHKADTERKIRASAGYGDRVNPEAMNHLLASRAEEAILGILMLYPELYKKVKDILLPDDFVTSFNRSVFERYREISDELAEGGYQFDLGYLAPTFDAQQMGRISAMISARRALTANDEATLQDVIRTLKNEKHKRIQPDGSLEDMLEAIKKTKTQP